MPRKRIGAGQTDPFVGTKSDEVVIEQPMESKTEMSLHGTVPNYYGLTQYESDPLIKRVAKWGLQNVVDPIVRNIQQALAEVDKTWSYGVSATLTPSIVIFNGQMFVSFDNEGNIAVQASYSGGFTIGSASASISYFEMQTNAPNVEGLTGTGYQIGASGVAGIGLGADLNLLEDTTNDDWYYGGTISASGGAGFEFHVMWGETVTMWKSINVFDIYDNVYENIMEW